MFPFFLLDGKKDHFLACVKGENSKKKKKASNVRDGSKKLQNTKRQVRGKNNGSKKKKWKAPCFVERALMPSLPAAQLSLSGVCVCVSLLEKKKKK